MKMNKQQEIEKIKTILGCDYDYCESCYTHSKKSCTLRPMAERLVEAGYGDVRYAVKEVLNKVFRYVEEARLECEFQDKEGKKIIYANKQRKTFSLGFTKIL